MYACTETNKKEFSKNYIVNKEKKFNILISYRLIVYLKFKKRINQPK